MTRERLPITSILIGAGIGATVMCLLDPNQGRRRRAVLMDKSRHFANVTRDEVGKVGRDVRNRLNGARHRTTSLFEHEYASDDVIADRVRSRLGRDTAHTRALDVSVEDGVVRLSGAAPAREARRIRRHAGRVHGVRRVESRIEPLTRQGHGIEEDYDAATQSWNPTTRAATALVGAAALSWAAARRSPAAMAVGATGAALLARGLVNKPLRAVIGAGDAGVVRVRKTINIAAPVETVFKLWSRPELFPRFLTHLESVEPRGDRRYHWVATGPGGTRIDWDAQVTEVEPNRRLSWRSLDGSKVDTSGTVHFTPENGGTRVQVDMSYIPPGGLLGHSVARLTRQDPRTAMNADLARLKSLLEDGKTTAHGQEINLREILAQT